MAATASFEAFLEWLEVQQEHLLDELLTARDDCECGAMDESARRDLIVRALTLYEAYYVEKSRAARPNVFLLFYPPWCSSLECAFFWLSGFPPSSLFRLVATAVADLSSDQITRLHRLKTEIRMEEKALSKEHANIQEEISSPQIVKAMRRVGWRSHGTGEVDHDADVAMQPIRAAMEALIERADTLRARAATKVVELLSAAQSIRFLIAATQLEKHMRAKGRERDAVLGV